jgi:MFS family permease
MDAQGVAAGAPRSSTRHEIGFWSIAYAYLVVMAVATVPSPLYGLYQQRDGFSTFTITLVFGSYALGTTSSLFLAGHLSDWHGRRRVLLPGLGLALASTVVFLVWRDLPGLYVGRILSGLSVGMVAATATAYITELHVQSRPGAPITRAQIAGTGVSVGGIGVGALVSGLIAQYVRTPLTIPYVVFLIALGVAVVLVTLTPETRARAVPRPAYRPQRISVPDDARGQFFSALGGATVAFAALGLFTGLAGVFLVGTLHKTSLALSGGTVAAVFGGAVVMQFVTMAWSRRVALLAGMSLMLVGLGLVVLAAWLPTPNLASFLAGGVLAGMGAGGVFKGSLGTVLTITAPEHRAEALAGLLLAGYVGLSVPAIGVGVALRSVTTKSTLLGFAIVEAVAILASAPAQLRARRRDVLVSAGSSPSPVAGGERAPAREIERRAS